MEKMTLILFNPVQAHKALAELWMLIKSALMAGHRLVLEIRPEKRTDAQNRMMWSCLRDLAKQVNWYGNKLIDEEWKDVLTASLKGQKVVPGLDGGFVVCGQRTSKMSKAEMSDVITLAHAFGDGKEVKWSPASLGRDWDQPEAQEQQETAEACA